jgi:nucleoside-diphosphate-sugar epimerase
MMPEYHTFAGTRMSMVMKKLHPEVVAEHVDLAEPGDWQRHFYDAQVVVMLQAQIGGIDYQEFVQNNLHATRLVLEAVKNHHIPKEESHSIQMKLTPNQLPLLC